MLSETKSRHAGKSLFCFLFVLFLTAEICSQWVQTSGPNGDGVRAVAVSETNLFAGTVNGGIYFSSDIGTTWMSVNSGLPANIFYISQISVYGTKLFLLSSSNGVYYSNDNGANWTSFNSGLPDSNIVSFIVNSNVNGNADFFVGTHEGIFYSKDDGSIWTKIWDCGPPGLSSSPSCLAIISNENNGINLFVGNNWHGGLLRLNKNGTNWIVDTLITNISVHVMAVNENELFLGTSGNGVLLSTDYGSSWTQLNSGLVDINIRAMMIIGLNLFVGTMEHGVFTSADNGLSWTESNSCFPQLNGCVHGCPYVHEFVVLDSDIFAATNQGVWRRPLAEMVPVELTFFTAVANRKEVTLNWSTATELNNQGFEVQRKFGSNDFVTIGSVRGNGTTTTPNNYTYVDKLIDAGKYFYRLKQIDFGGKYEYSQVVEVNWSPFTTFKLKQNYPNPFNPTTTIGFGIAEKAKVKLSVLNLLGEEIRILLNEEKEAGYHSINFNASDLPSGVYFYKIQVYPAGSEVGKFIAVNKMLLVR